MTPEARQRRRIRTPVLVVTGLAWAGIMAFPWPHSAPQASSQDSTDSAVTMAGHAGHSGHSMGHLAPGAADTSLLVVVAAWAVMLVAMMAPLLIGPLRHVQARTLPRRRWRAMTLLVAGYVLVWSLVGLGLVTVAGSIQDRTVAVVVVLVATALWQLSPARQRCLNRHHARPPIAAFGRAADAGALRFGATTAGWCVGSCGALMLLPLLAGDAHLAVMVLVTIWIWAEQLDRPVPPSWRARLPLTALRMLAAQLRRLLRPGPRVRVVTP